MKCPWTDIGHDHYLYKVLLFLFMQSLYLLYIYASRPHKRDLFNWLEYWNEGALMLLAYISFAFTGIVQGQSTGNVLAEVLSQIIIIAIVLANFSVLLSRTYLKIKSTLEKRKLQKKLNAAK